MENKKTGLETWIKNLTILVEQLYENGEDYSEEEELLERVIAIREYILRGEL
jgi:hypothetical protein